MENIIHTFKGGNLFETTTALFKHLNISTQTFEEQAFLPQDFLKDLYKPEKHKAINEIYLVGIVTDEVFNGKSLAEVDNELSNDYQGLLIIAVDLKDKTANRTELSTLTRLFSRRLKAMPVAVLFRYGNHIALANAERTQYKQTYREGEKIGKVSILKDIDTLKPHRGHLRILEKLQIDKSIKTFKELYVKWLGVFDTKILNKEFYKELFAWYEWAISETSGIKYPNDPKAIKEERQLEKQIIRLITRVLFVWFIKQKGLVPEEIFDEKALSDILKDFDLKSETKGEYYNAILQNLFFATLNKEITERAFAKEKNSRDVKTLYRYAEMFSISEEKVIELFKPVPFLNGGLFECLDKDQGNDGKRYHLDGFSRNENTKEDGNRFRQRALIPNIFFFEKDKGLFSILNKYYFTVEENTPEEVQVALDPELLGNVFENLLGAFNPETEESARKLSGSFYTPKEIVNYMVDESLKVYLKNHLPSFSSKLIDELFEGQDLTTDFDDITKRKQVAECLRKVKILDPACGSGAFPMGILNRMVHILEKLGVDINETNYQLKRHLIEKCIYGVDIQTTATQISKLRFFISLILEQSETNTDPALNYGIQPLPNLETKFVTANTLIDIREKKVEVQGDLFESSITTIKEELIKIREAHFEASSPYKKKVLRGQDKILREKLIQKFKEFGEATPDNAKQFAEWDPYDQNASASFFDPEWMFGVSDGFDIVIGNPPYVQLQKSGGKLAKLYEEQKFNTFARTGDIYSLFYEKAHQLLKQGGICNFITSNKWMRAGYGEATRKFFIEHTNPLILIDFAGIKVFDTATVDVNILLYAKEKSTFNTQACIVKDKELKELSLYVRQHAQTTQFKNADSWVILSDIEQRIKAKIEAIGTPLKDWDIQINYGIKTGFNDAFIIDGKKRTELIAQDPKSEEIIRPILRGRDIKRYGYEFADLYLINAHNGVKEKGIKRIHIEDYPAVKAHLDSFYPEIEKRADQGDTPYNLRNCAYIEDFYKQKIMYSEIVREPQFYLDNKGEFFAEATTFIMTGSNLEYLYYLLHSKAITYFFKTFYAGGGLGGDGYRYKKVFLEKLPIPPIKNNTIFKTREEVEEYIYLAYNLDQEEIDLIIKK
ncbi:Eco57I restriction-modification methylase domain-containing protein [Capnocytophaga sp.]